MFEEIWLITWVIIALFLGMLEATMAFRLMIRNYKVLKIYRDEFPRTFKKYFPEDLEIWKLWIPPWSIRHMFKYGNFNGDFWFKRIKDGNEYTDSYRREYFRWIKISVIVAVVVIIVFILSIFLLW